MGPYNVNKAPTTDDIKTFHVRRLDLLRIFDLRGILFFRNYVIYKESPFW